MTNALEAFMNSFLFRNERKTFIIPNERNNYNTKQHAYELHNSLKRIKPFMKH